METKNEFKTIDLSNKIKLIGVKTRTSNEKIEAINAFWQEFYSKGIFDQIPNKIDPRFVFGVYTNYESDYNGEYDLIIACEVAGFEGISDDLISFVIPKDKYAIFQESAAMPMHDKIGLLWNRIWSSQLNRKYAIDFEKYEVSTCFSENPNIQVNISIK
jgi:predicted transcriptional regulator YdeE